MTGAYAIPHLAIRNRVALTNKTPSGLNRGFGGPQVYYALERLMEVNGIGRRSRGTPNMMVVPVNGAAVDPRKLPIMYAPTSEDPTSPN